MYDTLNIKKEIKQCTYCGKYHTGRLLYFCSERCKNNSIKSDKLTAENLEQLEERYLSYMN
jgi:endogenous inhibitor of DNA gyrase (YacG/DUF329 family)